MTATATAAPPALDELIGVGTAARLLGVTRQTAHVWALSGKLERFTIDGKIHVRLGDALRLRAERAQRKTRTA